MKTRSGWRLALPVVGTLLLALVLPTTAFAVLGGAADASSGQAMRGKLALRMTPDGKNYTVHQVQTAAGTTVREYATADGKVFGVAWQGPMLPDLRELLGTYFAQYRDAARIKNGGRGAVRIQQADLVVHSSGRMRAFSGQAYDPSLLPQGVAPEELQ